MKKIITAMGEEYFNKELKKRNINVIGNDIQYIEGIIEQLEVDKQINFIIISDKIFSKNNVKEIITKIKLINKKIKIIIIIEKYNKKLLSYLENKKIKYYFNLNKKNSKIINHLIYYFNIDRIKLNNKLKNKKYYKFKKKIKNKNYKTEKIKIRKNKMNDKPLPKIITIVGNNGVGKSIFTVIFSKLYKSRLLVIDFDIFNNSLHTIYNVNTNKNIIINQIEDIEKIKINHNIDLLSDLTLLFENKKEDERKKIIDFIFKNKSKAYENILIDTTSNIQNKDMKKVLFKSNYIIFITEGNLTQLKKSKKLLDIYIHKWNIKKEKFNLILNKKDKNSISKNIIKNVFSEINFLGEISYNSNYNNFINRHLKTLKFHKNVIREYEKIINQIIKR